MSSRETFWRSRSEVSSLGEREVHVWRASLDQSEATRSRLSQTLAQDERERAARFATEKLRNRYVVGRGILRSLLGSYLETSPRDLELGYGDHGKPHLIGDSARSGLQFNASHSHDMGVFAFGRGPEIGVDVEWIRDDLAQTEIASRFFSAAESEWLASLATADQIDSFFSLWTCKEAFVKAQGGGISFGLDRFDVQLESGAEPVPIISNEEGESFSPWVAHQFCPGRGFAGALAVEERDLEISYWDWSHAGD